MRILFIDNYDSFTYNVIEIFRQFLDVELTLAKNDALSEIDIKSFDKLIISPGPNLPAAAGGLMQFIDKNIRSIPTLGICLGHQAIAEYFGGLLEQYEDPKHGEKTNLHVLDNGVLFKELPQTFEVGLYHSWFVSKDNFPAELKVIAKNDTEIIMALKHKILPIYSVQFHPESYMSQYGKEILHNFIYRS